MKTTPKYILIIVLSFCVLPSAPAGEKSTNSGKADSAPPMVSDIRKWQWNVQAGGAYRHFGGVDFQTGSLSAAGLLPVLRPRLTGGRGDSAASLGIGPTTGFADRMYRDGFVFMDDDTSSADSFLPGTTAYWGYQSATQVQDGRLNYHGGEYATSASRDDQTSLPGDWSDDLDGFAPVVEIEALLPLSPHFSLGGTFGFMFSSIDTTHSATTFRASQQLVETAFSVTDHYDLQGVVPPAAPYAGTFTHPGTAPLIDNIPSRRSFTSAGAASQSATFFNTVEETFDLDLSALSLGPTLKWDYGRLFFAGRCGLALNVASWEAGAVERLYRDSAGRRTQIRRWDHESSGTKVLPGLFLQAAAGFQINQSWSVSLFGRRDWSETLRGTVGPSSFSADLSGYTIGGAIVKTF